MKHLLFLLITFVALPAQIVSAGTTYQNISIYSKNTGFNEYEICAATIAKIFGRPIKIMNVKTTDGDVYYVKYKRSSDGSIWTNKCKVDGNRVIWGSKDGRWRTHSADGYITYRVKGDSLVITEKFSDGSQGESSFKKSDY